MKRTILTVAARRIAVVTLSLSTLVLGVGGLEPMPAQADQTAPPPSESPTTYMGLNTGFAPRKCCRIKFHKPGPVQNATADPVDPTIVNPGEVIVKWDPPTGLGYYPATFYFVRAFSSGGVINDSVPITETSLIIYNPFGPKTAPQSYEVYACRGAIPPPNSFSPLPDCGPRVDAYLPLSADPGPMSVSSVTDFDVTLAWVPPPSWIYVPFAGYNVQMDGGEVRSVLGTTTFDNSFTWTGLEPGSTHTFTVQACYVRACSEFVSPTEATTISS
jgi:Fibronectin type III domain